jgi:hypothetical protein
MDRSFFFIGIAFFGMINGLFNPAISFTYLFSNILMSAPLFGSQALILYFASLMQATATVILGGIPAAIYERATGSAADSTLTSLWIWLAGTAVLTLPAIGNVIEIGL